MCKAVKDTNQILNVEGWEKEGSKWERREEDERERGMEERR